MLNYVATDPTVQIVFLFVVLGTIIAVGTLRTQLAHKRLQMMENNAQRKANADSELLKYQHTAIEHKTEPK